MTTLPTDDQLNEPQLLAEVNRLATDLRLIRGQLQMEQQHALAINNVPKGTTIKHALNKEIHKKKPDEVLAQLVAIGEAKCPWALSATHQKDDLVNAIGAVLTDGRKIGQVWVELLRTYEVPNLSREPLGQR